MAGPEAPVPGELPLRRRCAPLVAAALVVAAAGCAGPERSEPPLPEDVYVEVMARLSAIRSATDPGRTASPLPDARADSIRREVLREHGVSRSELKAFARVVGDEPERMKALWKEVSATADSLREAGWPAGAESAAPEEEP